MLTMSGFLKELQESHPQELVTIEDQVDPAKFGVTAVLQEFENKKKYPVGYFTNLLNLKGERSRFPLITNIFATRERCALSLGLDVSQSKLPLSLEYVRRENNLLPVVSVPRGEAPVKEVVKQGDEADLREFPIVRHHTMDLAPYIDMIPIMRDPDSGAYNAAFLRTMYKSPRRLGLQMEVRDNWEICRKYEAADKGTPVVIVSGHHPAFSLGALNVASFETDDYQLIGSVMGEPLRVTPSETWGEDFMVPADAEILIEGHVLPKVREIEGPFGEYTGYFGPQVYLPVIEVTAITYRHDAIYQNAFVGHAENWVMGALPKEAVIYNRIKAVLPMVKSVHIPNSGCGRLNVYISISKQADGEGKQAALIALGNWLYAKNVIVVDEDVDPFNEEEVMWAVATRTQADDDVEILKNVKGSILDPSLKGDVMTAKMVIDATRPVGRAFAKRLDIPAEALDKARSLLQARDLL